MNASRFILLLFAVPIASVAADGCFCLETKDDHFRHGCEMQTQGLREVAQCRDDAGNPYKIDDMTARTKLAAGQGRCNPCKQTINARGGDIRGPDDPKYSCVQAATTYLQEKTGKASQPQEIVDALNRVVVGIYQKGDYRTGLAVFEQTCQFAEQKLGPEHPDILTVQLNYTVNLVNLKRPKQALQMLQRMEPRLLERAALQLRITPADVA